MATADSEKRQVRTGVPPLQAGGYPFLLRRLHSLAGIFPVGAFAVLLILIGLVTLRAFFRWPTQPIPLTTGSAIFARQLDESPFLN